MSQLPAEYNSSAKTLTHTQETKLQTDASGNQKVTLATLISGEDTTNGVMKIENRASYLALNLTAGLAYLVKSGAGRLMGIMVNHIGTSASSLKLNDGLTATATKNTLGDNSMMVYLYQLSTGYFDFHDIEFNTGLHLTTAGSPEITIFYK